MTDTLPGLLRSYEFLNLALINHGSRMVAYESRRLRAERARIFKEIVAHSSSNVRITMAQLRFIIQNLPFIASEDPDLLPAFTEMAARHLDDIALHLPTGPLPVCVGAAGGISDAARFESFDNLSDRIGIVGKDYRYIFTNASNARFHGKSQRSFLGRPIWTMTGERFFERINRPRMERVFAGHSDTCCCRNPKWASVLQLVTFDPLRDEDGNVAGVVIVSRDVSHLPIPETLIATLDEE
jgi:PAS domain-containing protein